MNLVTRASKKLLLLGAIRCSRWIHGIAGKLAIDQGGEVRGVAGGGERGEKPPVDDNLAVVAREGKVGSAQAVGFRASRGKGVANGGRCRGGWLVDRGEIGAASLARR